MKKQIKPTVKVRLLQGAFLLGVLFLVTHVIPLALGQRESNKRTSLPSVPVVCPTPWQFIANMPDVRSFMASGYNSANGKIYLVSGYNTGSVGSAQPDTWEYDPVANTFTSKTPFPWPAGGFASGVINGHLYVAGGRDRTDTFIT